MAAADIGVELGTLDPATGATLVLAGLLSVMLFPLVALLLLRDDERTSGAERS